MIIGLQVIALLFAFSMVYFAILGYKRKDLGKSEIVLWVMLWSLAIIVIVFPEILRKFSMTFLVTRVFDLMVIGGFILVITLIGSTYIRTKRNERKLEELVRNETLKNAKSKK